MKKISLILLIIWMYIIYYLSNQNGLESSELSTGLIYNTLEFIYNLFNLNKSNINIVFTELHIIIRELFHVIEYLILGILTINYIIKTKYKEVIVISFMICFIYSLTDEIHQIFVSGRTFEYLDIGMDFIGYTLGIIIFIFIKKIYKK